MSVFESESDSDVNVLSTSQDKILVKAEIRRVNKDPTQPQYEIARGTINIKYTESLPTADSDGSVKILPFDSDIKSEPMESTITPFIPIKGQLRYRVIKKPSDESSRIEYEVIPFDSEPTHESEESQQIPSMFKSESDVSSDSYGNYWTNIKSEPTDEPSSEFNTDTSTFPNTHRIYPPTDTKSPTLQTDMDTSSQSTKYDGFDSASQISFQQPRRAYKPRKKKSAQTALERLEETASARKSDKETSSQSIENDGNSIKSQSSSEPSLRVKKSVAKKLAPKRVTKKTAKALSKRKATVDTSSSPTIHDEREIVTRPAAMSSDGADTSERKLTEEEIAAAAELERVFIFVRLI
ncbi:hypothetical protein RF11_16310 [Thelohanellus kitauei]|uniref:Uncharacterized protein n=1 Tax=Thelohanellus kitauei TaxID=669202 RepID=A0A0C2J738_THEKT|nr:hypothetical protein RF11_16310 [Thelohanellus kitauei]